MTGTEMITNFKLEGATVKDLMKAITAHCKQAGHEPEEYGFHADSTLESQAIPDGRTRRWLIAFAVEGNSEGYYVHVGAMVPGNKTDVPNTLRDCRGMIECNCSGECDGTCTHAETKRDGQFMLGVYVYINLGLAKTYSPDSAYALAREAQRFLTAAAWN